MSFLKKLAADRSVERAFWTLAEAAATFVGTQATGKLAFGGASAAILFAVKEFFARKAKA